MHPPSCKRPTEKQESLQQETAKKVKSPGAFNVSGKSEGAVGLFSMEKAEEQFDSNLKHSYRNIMVRLFVAVADGVTKGICKNFFIMSVIHTSRGYGVSRLEGFQDLSGQSYKQPDLELMTIILEQPSRRLD